MSSKYHLGLADYLVITLTLMISVAIGIKIKFFGSKQRTTKEYLLAGRNMPVLPVIFSISVTMVSAVSMLSTPSEVYRYGIQPAMRPIGSSIGMVLAAFVFIPVYFQCGVSTVYEFLEMRFGKPTRYAVSAMFIVQMVLYMAVALYAPVLALNAVTDLSIEISIIAFGSICSLYCVIGGLKAVLWTDVFQSFLMIFTIIAIYAAGIIDTEGLTNIYERASTGQRLNFFNLQFDLNTRYTFWNTLLQGIVFGFSSFGTSQIEVQRLLSLGNAKTAKRTLLFSIFPVASLYMLCNVFGLILYAVYFLCDPISNSRETGLTKYDQLVPYFIVSKFQSIPGLTGLCIVGIFSGSLTTISSALNSLAAVTVLDFIQPFVSKTRLSETKSVFIAKSVCLVYGIICISLAFTLINTSSVKQANSLFNSIVDGPTAAIFVIGVLTRKGYGKNALLGLLAGYFITSWIGFNILLRGYVEPSLPLNTSMCKTALNFSDTFSNMMPSSLNIDAYRSDITSSAVSKSEMFAMYKVSFVWIKPLGFLITLCCTIVSILVSGWKTVPIPSNLLSPVTIIWTKRSEAVKSYKDNDNNTAEALLNNLTSTEYSEKRYVPVLH